MSKYPVYLELKNRRVVVIGAGAVAARKVQSLLATGANIRVVTKTIDPVFEQFSKEALVQIVENPYSSQFIKDAFLVIAATNDNELNKQIYNDCQQLKVLCNVVDVPGLCDFYVPAVIRRNDLQLAISTSGKCPAFTAHLRQKLQEIITEEHGQFLDLLDQARKTIKQQVPARKRKALLDKLADDNSFQLFLEKGCDGWESMAQVLIEEEKK